MRAIRVIFVLVVIISVYSCNETNILLPDAFTINGKVTFVDSNFTLGGGGQYIVYAWDKDLWNPLGGNPESGQVIDIVKQNNQYVMQYQYKLTNVESGSYVVSLMYTDGATYFDILGVYSCSVSPTDSLCFENPNNYATIVTTEGLLNIDFNAYGDTTANRP